jgi:hypothetical protein
LTEFHPLEHLIDITRTNPILRNRSAEAAEATCAAYCQLGMRYEEAKALGFYGVALLQTRRRATRTPNRDTIRTVPDLNSGFE